VSKLFGVAAGVITAACAAVPFTLLWFGTPIARLPALNSGRSVAPSAWQAVARSAPESLQTAKSVRYHSPVAVEDHLAVDVRREQDRVVLHLSGELDLASAPILERALENRDLGSAELVVLDLDELKFVDSSGLRIILLAHERARERGQEFAITPGSPQVQRLLSITSVTEHLHVITAPGELPARPA
jgi:anti-anti-sigma factor